MRIKRLKQPKYLLGGIVGGLYFYWYFFRMLFASARRGGQPLPLLASPENLALYESIGALFLLTIMLLAWIIPHQRAALTFTEAEVAFLFPAPISRRGADPFQAAAFADRHSVHDAAADAVHQPDRRPCRGFTPRAGG